MIGAMLQGLAEVLQVQSLSYMLAGVLIGLTIGIIPGLGGNLALALFIPFVYGLDPAAGFAFLLGMHAVVYTGGSISAVLINTPGTGPSAATCLDGHPLAQQGQGGRAVGAAVTASGLGGVVGAICMAATLPAVRPVVLSFGPPEFFMLAILGITLISMVSGRSLLKGLIAGGLGLVMSFVGMDPQTGVVRYGFGQLYLWDGLPLVPVVVGLFGLPEVIDIIRKGRSIAQGEFKVGRDVLQGVKDVLRHWWLMIRCAAIGNVMGIIPGLGGEAAAFIAYGYAAQSSKNPEKFGKGAIEGVIGPESANNAKEGGALVPTVAFGIPGSSAMAILLGAFLILGLTPGPAMLKEHLDVVWSMVWSLAIANLFAAAICLGLAGPLAHLTTVRPSVLAPFIVIFVMVGSFLTTGHLGDIVVALLMGLVGYFMKKFDYARAALILGFILGEIAETNLHLSLRLWGTSFLLRPITLVLLGLVVLSVCYAYWLASRKSGGQVAKA